MAVPFKSDDAVTQHDVQPGEDLGEESGEDPGGQQLQAALSTAIRAGGSAFGIPAGIYRFDQALMD